MAAIVPLTTSRPELSDLVRQINDRLLGALRGLTADNLSPGTIMPRGVLLGRMPRGGVIYDSNALPVAETIEVPTESGMWLRWRIDYTWDADDKLLNYTLTDPNSRQVGKWSIMWEWDGFEWFVARIDARMD